jgi:hypothetical protein
VVYSLLRSLGSKDIISAGGDDDTVDVYDGAVGDIMDCEGKDTVFFDPGDTVSNCEI